jgi:hypothetical protein
MCLRFAMPSDLTKTHTCSGSLNINRQQRGEGEGLLTHIKQWKTGRKLINYCLNMNNEQYEYTDILCLSYKIST